MQMIVLALSLLLSATCLLYLVLLSNRLTSNHREARPQSPLSDEELSNVSYEDIDMLKSIPAQPTHQNYVLIGGSGYLGTYIAKLLLLRGETSIRVLDLYPPVPEVASNPAVTFNQTDITTMHSVREGLTTPFPGKSGRATVIFHTAALIRFWERASYTWDTSHKVNVLGTSNVLSVAKKLPNAILIFTSSADTAIPGPKFLKLGFDQKITPKDKITISDEDAPLSPDAGPESSYTRSKIAAERLVIGSNGWNGLKTGIIRPGHTIMGPNDRLLTSALTMPRVPVFDSIWSHTNVCVWDAAAAHICYADAMQRIPEETAGQTFLVTGKGPAWRIRDTRNALKFYSTRPLVFDQIPPLFIYILAHLVEIFLYLRYYTLAPFYLLRSRELNLAPRWMGQLVLLQPATFEYWLDVVIDDSRARKIFGYQPQWETAQVIRYTVDEMQSGRARKGHGLELKVD